jgi:hypothetical protein
MESKKGKWDKCAITPLMMLIERSGSASELSIGSARNGTVQSGGMMFFRSMITQESVCALCHFSIQAF